MFSRCSFFIIHVPAEKWNKFCVFYILEMPGPCQSAEHGAALGAHTPNRILPGVTVPPAESKRDPSAGNTVSNQQHTHCIILHKVHFCNRWQKTALRCFAGLQKIFQQKQKHIAFQLLLCYPSMYGWRIGRRSYVWIEKYPNTHR